ncbi:hypothetical protein AGABI2DRAFT_177131 [Agaricus bisporus var. bisporus H97]|uniref:hypothetical protein n=1 Tax=Agaricus bisporus var. bisporus (strain H97 / ATCC MYA-4626 / FGSC 10389) TaxID=936046 RepID=UPI00029F7100|nr:hypothetical protein AGABI2DRAFT_177131 [Agaricus bisporus var. bisporus H97]EKV48947.1 hypothetical protein AGABI2DRAFT_177131 [Agaricus bisporus var. bisporus H97]
MPMGSKKPNSSYLNKSDLAAALGLQEDCQLFLNLRDRVREISHQIFNPHESYDRQENEKIAEFSAKMGQEFPDVLQDPTLPSAVRRQRMKAILIYCGQCFKAYRFAQRAKEKKTTNPSLSTPPSAKGVKKASVRAATYRLVSSPDPPGSRRKSRTPGPSTSTHIRRAAAPNASGSGTSDERAALRAPPPVPSTSSSDALAHSPYSTLIDRYNARKPEACINDVAEFLGTCNPDLRYLLPSFMAYGCRNVEYLINISCQQEREIEMLLKKMMKRYPPPGGIEEMDFVVVVKHFKEYFFGQSK